MIDPSGAGCQYSAGGWWCHAVCTVKRLDMQTWTESLLAVLFPTG